MVKVGIKQLWSRLDSIRYCSQTASKRWRQLIKLPNTGHSGLVSDCSASDFINQISPRAVAFILKDTAMIGWIL